MKGGEKTKESQVGSTKKYKTGTYDATVGSDEGPDKHLTEAREKGNEEERVHRSEAICDKSDDGSAHGGG